MICSFFFDSNASGQRKDDLSSQVELLFLRSLFFCGSSYLIFTAEIDTLSQRDVGLICQEFTSPLV